MVGAGMERGRRGERAGALFYVAAGEKRKSPAAVPALALCSYVVCALCVSFKEWFGRGWNCSAALAFWFPASASSFFLPSPLFATLRLTLTHLQCPQQDRLVLLLILLLVPMASAPFTKQSATKKVRLKTRG